MPDPARLVAARLLDHAQAMLVANAQCNAWPSVMAASRLISTSGPTFDRNARREEMLGFQVAQHSAPFATNDGLDRDARITSAAPPQRRWLDFGLTSRREIVPAPAAARPGPEAVTRPRLGVDIQSPGSVEHVRSAHTEASLASSFATPSRGRCVRARQIRLESGRGWRPSGVGDDDGASCRWGNVCSQGRFQISGRPSINLAISWSNAQVHACVRKYTHA